MSDNNENLSLLSQLDDSEKSDIITDEELEEIGVAYGSRKKYEEAMRFLEYRISGTQVGRKNVSIPVGGETRSGRIYKGKTIVPYGNIPKIKKINIVGKTIKSPRDAALLFSAFRDPRIEINNIFYTSLDGKVLAHTAWTCGLPGINIAYPNKSVVEGFHQINNLITNLDADKIWFSHNHPSGNPDPSVEDIHVSKYYANYFKEKFAGQIIIDHNDYSVITNDGTSIRVPFNEPLKNYISKTRENADIIRRPETIANKFKKIFLNFDDINAFAILDRKHHIVCWTYGDSDNPNEIKDFMRAAGGDCVISMTNSDDMYKKYNSMSIKISNTENDIFLDVIQISRIDGDVLKSSPKNANWQTAQILNIKYIINNQNMHDLEITSNTNLNKDLIKENSNLYNQKIANNKEINMPTKEYVISKEKDFDGHPWTILSDGIETWSGKTKSEYESYKFEILSEKQFNNKLDTYLKSISGKWNEITEEKYNDKLNILPPVAYNNGGFLYLRHIHIMYMLFIKNILVNFMSPCIQLILQGTKF